MSVSAKFQGHGYAISGRVSVRRQLLFAESCSRIPSSRRWFRKQSAREAHASAFDGPRHSVVITSFTAAKAAVSLKCNRPLMGKKHCLDMLDDLMPGTFKEDDCPC